MSARKSPRHTRKEAPALPGANRQEAQRLQDCKVQDFREATSQLWPLEAGNVRSLLHPLPVGSGGDPLRGCSAWRQRARRRSGHRPTLFWPRAPGPAAQVAGDGASVSQDGGSGPIGSRAPSPDRRRTVANGRAAEVGLRPPAVSVATSARPLITDRIVTLTWREECRVAEECPPTYSPRRRAISERQNRSTSAGRFCNAGGWPDRTVRRISSCSAAGRSCQSAFSTA